MYNICLYKCSDILKIEKKSSVKISLKVILEFQLFRFYVFQKGM